MKPFNLEEALNGAPLITKDGKDKNVILRNVIIGAKHPLISEIVNLDGSLSHQSYYLNGKLTKDKEFDKDLFMQEDSDLEEKNDKFYTTNNPESFKNQLFDMLKKSPNNLIKKDFGKEKIVNFIYTLECIIETDLENGKINHVDLSKETLIKTHVIKIEDFLKN